MQIGNRTTVQLVPVESGCASAFPSPDAMPLQLDEYRSLAGRRRYPGISDLVPRVFAVCAAEPGGVDLDLQAVPVHDNAVQVRGPIVGGGRASLLSVRSAEPPVAMPTTKVLKPAAFAAATTASAAASSIPPAPIGLRRKRR